MRCGVARLIETMDPDVIIIDIENPNRDMMEHMFQLTRMISRPAVHVSSTVPTAPPSRRPSMPGVSAYVVDG